MANLDLEQGVKGPERVHILTLHVEELVPVCCDLCCLES